MIRVRIHESKKKNTEFPYYDDDIKDLEKQEKSNQKKALNKSAKAIATGKLTEDKVDTVIEQSINLTEVEEVAKALDLYKVLDFIQREGAKINPILIKKINNVKLLRGIEHLMEDGTPFSTACKIVLEDG